MRSTRTMISPQMCSPPGIFVLAHMILAKQEEDCRPKICTLSTPCFDLVFHTMVSSDDIISSRPGNPVVYLSLQRFMINPPLVMHSSTSTTTSRPLGPDQGRANQKRCYLRARRGYIKSQWQQMIPSTDSGQLKRLLLAKLATQSKKRAETLSSRTSALLLVQGVGLLSMTLLIEKRQHIGLGKLFIKRDHDNKGALLLVVLSSNVLLPLGHQWRCQYCRPQKSLTKKNKHPCQIYSKIWLNPYKEAVVILAAKSPSSFLYQQLVLVIL